MFCLLVVLVKFSVLVNWLARKTPLRKPNHGEGILSTKPRLKSVYDFLWVGVLFHHLIEYVSCLTALRDIFHTAVWHDICAEKHQSVNRDIVHVCHCRCVTLSICVIVNVCHCPCVSLSMCVIVHLCHCRCVSLSVCDIVNVCQCLQSSLVWTCTRRSCQPGPRGCSLPSYCFTSSSSCCWRFTAALMLANRNVRMFITWRIIVITRMNAIINTA